MTFDLLVDRALNHLLEDPIYNWGPEAWAASAAARHKEHVDTSSQAQRSVDDSHGDHSKGGHELEHTGHQLHSLHDLEHVAHGHNVMAIVASHTYNHAAKVLSKVFDKVPGMKKVGQAITNVMDKTNKAADKLIAGMASRYGPATAGAVLGAGSLIAGSALGALHIGALHALPKKGLIGAIPLIGALEAGKVLGIVGKGTPLEKTLETAGSWLHAIKHTVEKGVSKAVEKVGKTVEKGLHKAARSAGKGVRALGLAGNEGFIFNEDLSEEQIQQIAHQFMQDLQAEFAKAQKGEKHFNKIGDLMKACRDNGGEDTQDQSSQQQSQDIQPPTTNPISNLDDLIARVRINLNYNPQGCNQYRACGVSQGGEKHSIKSMFGGSLTDKIPELKKYGIKVTHATDKNIISKSIDKVNKFGNDVAKGISRAALAVKDKLLHPLTPLSKANAIGQEQLPHPSNAKYHLVGATAELVKAGVAGGLSEPLHKSTALREMAISQPTKFDQLVRKVQDSLRNSNKAATSGATTREEMHDHLKLTARKEAQLRKLKDDVSQFRDKHQPEEIPYADEEFDLKDFSIEMPKEPKTDAVGKVKTDDVQILPEHFGKRVASSINMAYALDHLASGGDHKSAVDHIMKKGGVLESTAKRYVRKALKHIAGHIDKELELRKEIPTTNSFCPTGPGGGVDPSCSPNGGEIGEGIGISHDLVEKIGNTLDNSIPSSVRTNKGVLSGIKSYVQATKNGYKSINAKIRSKGIESLPGDIQDLNKAAANHHLPVGTILYRGIDEKVYNKHFSKASAGDEIEAKGLQSTSINPEVAESWSAQQANTMKDLSYVLSIKAKKGLYVENLGGRRAEREVIQAHKTRYKLVGVSDHRPGVLSGSGVTKVIRLEEI